MRITVIWQDGAVTTGKSWEATEQAIRSQQWRRYSDRSAFRRDLRHRAKVWSGVRPDIVQATSKAFIQALEHSGLCRVEVEETVK
jgi:hypothetical protein